MFEGTQSRTATSIGFKWVRKVRNSVESLCKEATSHLSSVSECSGEGLKSYR